MTDHPECDQFPESLRQICRGEALTPDLCSQYRIGWGLTPLEGWQPPPVPSAVTVAPTTAQSPVSTEQAPPSLLQRAWTFTSALVDHARDGFAKCDEALIQQRLDICQGCPSFNGSHCVECGCACNSQSVFFNKLAWRSEKCPLDHW